MPGLVPGIHVLFPFLDHKDVDGRDKPGHDGALNAVDPSRRLSADAESLSLLAIPLQ
jgi:hypothetical protein